MGLHLLQLQVQENFIRKEPYTVRKYSIMII